jgi:hypothetical protein
MTKLDRFNYQVQRDEKVTLRASLRDLPGNAIGVGQPMTREPGAGDPTFSFVVPPTGDTEISVLAEVDFVNAPNGAQAVLFVKGDKGGGEFEAVTITSDSGVKSPAFKFRVQ